MASEIMFYGGIIGAILLGVGAITLFFIFRIYAVIGELTGITAKRSIRKIQKEGYERKSKKRAIRENTDKIVAKRGRTTGRLQPKTKKQRAVDVQSVKDKTVVLHENTNVETVVLHQEINVETVVLNQRLEDKITIRNQKSVEETAALQKPQNTFEVVEDIVITHADETI